MILKDSESRQQDKSRRLMDKEIRRRWPDCYCVPGIGWCGPQWREVEAYEQEEPKR